MATSALQAIPFSSMICGVLYLSPGGDYVLTD